MLHEPGLEVTPSPKWRSILAVLIAIAVGTVGALVPEFFLTLLCAGIVTAGVLFLPRATMPALFVALSLQGAAARILERSISELSTVVLRLDEIALVAATVRLCVLLLWGDRSWFVKRDWLWPVVFVASGLLSSAIHWSGMAPALFGMALAAKFFGFLALSLSVQWDEGDGERLVKFMAWTVVLLFLVGFLGYLAPDLSTYVAAVEGDVDYARGETTPFMLPFINPGLYGWASSVGLLACLALVLERNSKVAIAGMATGAVAAILSLRRRPLLAVPIALLSVLVRPKHKRRVLALGAMVVVLGGAAWFGANLIRITIADTVQNYLDPMAREQTARGALTAGGVVLAQENFPLGEGFGKYGGYASQLFYSDVYDQLGLSAIYGLSPDTPYYLTDTYWPHLLGEVGLAGTLAMLLALWYYWRRANSINADLANPESIRLVALYASLVLIEGTVESLGGPVFEFPLQAFVIAVPLGMALRLGRASSGRAYVDHSVDSIGSTQPT